MDKGIRKKDTKIEVHSLKKDLCENAISFIVFKVLKFKM